MTEKKKYYPELNAKINFPEMEKNILNFWEEDKTFEKSVHNRDGAAEFVFYDGPPFANGTPHYGHMMVSYVKDAVARFQTMSGKKVERRLGWDCHGLPAEMSAEKQLGVSGRKQIEAYGVEKFNDFCRKDVLKYSNIWVDMFKRIGRWVDFNHDYKTMNLPFMESVIHNFKELYDKGLVYEDYRVLPYSWAAETPLSNFEVNLGYRDKTDNAITVMFTLESGQKILVWTTTPWTLPSNLMLAVGKDIDYVVMNENGQDYILAEARLGSYKKQLENATVVKKIKGSELVGMNYTPMFPYFSHFKAKGAFKVLSGEFVSTEDGTGVVHIAPGFGQDDFDVCRAYDENFPVACPVDEAGKFTAEVPDYEGKQVFETNEPIMQWLKSNGLLVKKEQYTHTYPYCWRTDTPLIYKAMSSWFVKVTDFRDDMVKNNQQINWLPAHIKDGRFGKWLEGARDWSISRNRFWGTPIPVWKSDNPKFPRVDVLGSIAEIKEKTGFDVDNLHKPYIDDVIYPNPDDPSGKTMMRRVSDVFDCWFESGSMPYAQVHYPFENKEWFENHFPADFIVEAIDQTRGWFYTLMIISTFVTGKSPYKNVLVNDLLLDKYGKKMSKSKGNIVQPFDLMNEFGADTIRFYLPYVSPVWTPIKCDLDGLKEVYSKYLGTLKNAYSFFEMYANADKIDPRVYNVVISNRDVTDKWLLSRLNNTILKVTKAYEEYDLNKVVHYLVDFLNDDLSNWYIRSNRRRFWESELTESKKAVYQTTYEVLLAFVKLAAPITPYITEEIYQNLTGKTSIHLEDFPTYDESLIDEELENRMDLVRDVCSLGRNAREDAGIKVRQPLNFIIVPSIFKTVVGSLDSIIKEELNIKEIMYEEDMSLYMDYIVKPNFKVVGKIFGPKIKEFQELVATFDINDVNQIKAGYYTTDFNGEKLEITSDMITTTLKNKEGYKSATNGNISVVLDTTLTDDLLLEGLAREVVRKVQSLRKEADFIITDRITLYYNGNEMLDEMLATYEEYVKEETLSTSLVKDETLPKDIMLNDIAIALKVEKVK